MAEPVIAQKGPYILTLEPGNYTWCACGKSKNQPFCDGSHKDTPFTPKKFVLEKKTTVALCGCKRTGDAPYCDGSHNRV
jgi:CDGSH-type Zn-finger protein